MTDQPINRSYWGPPDRAKSIAATGAKPGDMVKCVGETPTAGKGMFSQFMPGNVYPVIDFCGVPCANGHRDGSSKSSPIPSRGYGYLWALA